MKVEVKNSSMGFGSILTLMFVAAKLIGYIDWSWWWVFSPIWIPLVILLGILVFSFVIYCGIQILKK